jgi:hypothetical protein
MTAKRQYFVHPHRGTILVKFGFCWPAFFFGSLWAAAKGQWFPLFAVLSVLDLTLWFATGYAEAHAQPLLALCALVGTLSYSWARGRYGNQWLRAGLQQQGFQPGCWR